MIGPGFVSSPGLALIRGTLLGPVWRLYNRRRRRMFLFVVFVLACGRGSRALRARTRPCASLERLRLPAGGLLLCAAHVGAASTGRMTRMAASTCCEGVLSTSARCILRRRPPAAFACVRGMSRSKMAGSKKRSTIYIRDISRRPWRRVDKLCVGHPDRIDEVTCIGALRAIKACTNPGRPFSQG